MKTSARTRSLFALAAVLFFVTGSARAQSGCGPQGSSSTLSLPRFAGSLGSSNLSTGGGSSYLYVLTQWGFARASLADPANPTGFTQVVIADEPGSGNGGLIDLNCDCHQGGTAFGVGEAPDGSARMISDFNAAKQAPSLLAPAQLGRADGGANVRFGQQVRVAIGSDGSTTSGMKITAIYVPSSGKYFGYVPTDQGVAVIDLTNTTGNTSKSSALQPSTILNWTSASSSSAVRVFAAKVTVGSSDLYLLAGSTGSTLRVATINASNGLPTESASIATTARPLSVWIANVSGRIFVFSAEGTSGLKAYEYQPSQFGGTLTPASVTIPGNFDRVIVKGGQFPAIFAHNKATAFVSNIEIWDTNWLIQGGAPRKAYSLPQQGSGDTYFDNSYEVVIKTTGSVTAYIYRLKSPATGEALVATQAVDISCIAADLTAPPLAGATITNLSAAGRSGVEASKNYYGDRWRIQNNSATAAPLDNIEWDWNVTSTPSPTFQADAAPTFSGTLPNAALTDFNQVFFPCDPSAAVAGNPLTGASCYGSVNSPAGTADFRIGVRSHNANGWSQSPFISSGITIQAPTARIAGFSAGVLRVLSGGQTDATGSDGNVADAAFNWAFFDSAGGDVGTQQGPKVSIPLASRTFRLTVVYSGGFTAPVLTGSIQQVDLVPDFSVSPAAVLHGTNVTLTNQMQKGTTTTLNAVRYDISSSATPPGSFPSTLASSFLSTGGTAAVTSPSTDGAFFVHLQYDFSGPQGANQLLTVSKPFSTTSFAPSPLVLIYTSAAHSTLASSFIPMQLTTGRAYYLFDDESLPAGVGHPGSQFYLSTNRNDTTVAGDQSLGSSTGYGPVSFTPSTACSTCSIKAVVSGAIGKVNIAISSGSTTPPPPPPPPPSENLHASLSCPSSGTAGVALTCTASATGGSSYSYAWNWGENVLSGAMTPGPATNSHTYSAAGSFNITVRVTSGSASATAVASVNIARGGPPSPSAGYTLTGATVNQFNGNWEAEAGRSIGFTATEPDGAATFAWAVAGGPTLTGRAVQHAFGSPGSKTVTLTVTGGGTATSGVTSTQIRFTVTPPSFQALMIPGAGHIDPVPPATDGTWATDISITNPGTQPMTLTLDFEPFGTTFPADLSQIPFNSVNSVPLAAGQSWSATDVVKSRLAKDGRGVLIIKYDGGNADPIATATVYYTQQGRAYGSSLPAFRVGPYGTTTQSLEVASEQTLVGLRNDGSYRFNVSLFNSTGQSGYFQLSAFGDDGVQVSLLDEAGASVTSRQFPIGAFQQALLQSGELGLNDPTKRYVLKASPVSSGGGLIAAASALDRRNNDLVQVSDDTPRIAAAADALIDYFIPGVGRIGRDDVADGSHWKTDLTLYSNSSLPRDLTFEYRYTDSLGVEQRVLAPVTVGSGKSVILDDVVGTVLARYAPAGVDLKQVSTLGLLRISYRAASDSSTAPLLIGGRIYDDRGEAGTAGMQLFVYSNGESVAVGSPLVLPGAQQNLRFRTNIGFFAMGDLPTRVHVTAVKPDGVAGGTFDFVLNDPTRSGHYVQLPMSAIPGIVGDPMTVKVEVLEGSRVGAYVVTVDQISSDSIFVQGRPTRLAN